MGQLDEFLNEFKPKDAEVTVAETPQATEAAPADTGVTEAKPPATEAAPAATPAPAATAPASDAPPASGQEQKSQTVPLSALEDERNKRKDWKAKAIRLEEQNAQLTRILSERGAAPQPHQPAQPQAPQRIDVLQDPEGYQRYIETQLQATPIIIRREMSEAMLLEAKPDAGEVLQEFAEMARANPSLIQQMDRQMNPAKFAYDYVKRSKVMEEIGSDPDAWKAKQLEALKAQWLAEMQAQQPVVPAQAAPTPKPAPSIPPSLATAPNVAPRGAAPPSAPEFNDIFAKKY